MADTNTTLGYSQAEELSEYFELDSRRYDNVIREDG